MMHTCSPSEFLTRWPASLKPVGLPHPAPALPAESVRLLTKYGLPVELTIRCYNDITLKFGEAATPLAAIWERELRRGCLLGDMPGEWSRFWHLADQDYLQGGGWICIEEGSGRLVVIDLDCPDPVYLLNRSLSSFYTTLAYFLDWSERADGSPAETVLLREALLRQNCVPAKELEPFWLNFIDATLDRGDPTTLAVSLAPVPANPRAGGERPSP